MKKNVREKLPQRLMIGFKLSGRRAIKGWSMWKLSQISGLAISQIQAIESGNSNYTIDSLIAYIDAFGLSIKFGEKDEKRETRLNELLNEFEKTEEKDENLS